MTAARQGLEDRKLSMLENVKNCCWFSGPRLFSLQSAVRAGEDRGPRSYALDPGARPDCGPIDS